MGVKLSLVSCPDCLTSLESTFLPHSRGLFSQSDAEVKVYCVGTQGGLMAGGQRHDVEHRQLQTTGKLHCICRTCHAFLGITCVFHTIAPLSMHHLLLSYTTPKAQLKSAAVMQT